MSTHHHQPRSTSTRDRHRRIVAHDSPPCHICQQPIDYSLGWVDGAHSPRCVKPNCRGCVPHPMRFEVDHIVPLSKGGLDAIENKSASHRRCNRSKSDHLETNSTAPLATSRAW